MDEALSKSINEAAREMLNDVCEIVRHGTDAECMYIISKALSKAVGELDDDTHNIILRQKLALAKQKIEEQEETAERLAFEVRGDIEELEAERDCFLKAFSEIEEVGGRNPLTVIYEARVAIEALAGRKTEGTKP